MHKTRTFQAIVTKFLPCTNTKPARVKATAQAGSVIVPYYVDGPHSDEDRHHAAAQALAERFGWGGRWYAGGMPGGRGNVYVCADHAAGAPELPLPAFVTTATP